MEVLYFHQHFSSPSGSTGIRSYCMARKLVEKGYMVTIVCGSYSGADTGLTNSFVNGQRRGMIDGINIIELELNYSNADNFFKRTATFIKYALKGIKLVFTERYDLIFASTTPLTIGIPGIIARWFRNKLFVFEVRDLWPELPKAMGVITNPIIIGLMSLLEWLSYHSAHHVIALSPGISKGIERRGISKDKVSLIPNGCDLDIFDNIVDSWRPNSIKATDLLVLYAGTHGVANGLDNVLDVANVLNSRGRNDIKFLFLGQGKLKQSLIDRSKNEGLNNVVFHEPVNKKTLAGLMSSADIGLQVLANVPVFYFGTSPNKFFDYISGGVPVLNNYPGWLAELIEDNNCGFTVKPDDPIEFANILEKIGDNRSNLTLKGLNARDLALKKFDRKILASEWVKILEDIYSKKFSK